MPRDDLIIISETSKTLKLCCVTQESAIPLYVETGSCVDLDWGRAVTATAQLTDLGREEQSPFSFHRERGDEGGRLPSLNTFSPKAFPAAEQVPRCVCSLCDNASSLRVTGQRHTACVAHD